MEDALLRIMLARSQHHMELFLGSTSLFRKLSCEISNLLYLGDKLGILTQHNGSGIG